jgi:hypothetical protein
VIDSNDGVRCLQLLGHESWSRPTHHPCYKHQDVHTILGWVYDLVSIVSTSREVLDSVPLLSNLPVKDNAIPQYRDCLGRWICCISGVGRFWAAVHTFVEPVGGL